MRVLRCLFAVVSLVGLFWGCDQAQSPKPLDKYTVTFDSQGGSAVAPLSGVTSGTVVAAPTPPTKTDFTFVGWYSDSGLTTAHRFSTPVTANLTLYAKWVAGTLSLFTVTFDSVGGSPVASVTDVVSGTSIAAPTEPTKADYTFSGWYSDSTYATTHSFSSSVTAPLTLYAKWTVVKPTSIQLMVDGTFPVANAGEADMLTAFRDLTGTTLTLNHPEHTIYGTKVDEAFASTAKPDVVLLGATQFTQLALAGKLADLTSLYNASSFRTRLKNPAMVDGMKIGGKVYGVPFQRGNGTVTYVRGDWLEAAKLSAPTTYAEFLALLRTFKNNNPAGLASTEVIAITAAGWVNAEYPGDIYLREFYQDATPDFVLRNGAWVDGMAEQAMVAALRRMNTAWNEGLVDRSIASNKTSTCRDKFNTGKVGVFNYWAGQWNQNLQNTLIVTVPTGTVRAIAPIGETKYIERPAGVFAIAAGTAKVPGVFQVFHETALDGGPGQKWAGFGVKGIFYDEIDGVLTFKKIGTSANPASKGFLSPSDMTANWKPGAEPNWAPSSLATHSQQVFDANNKVLPVIPLNPFKTATSSANVSAVYAARVKHITQMAEGTVTIEAGLAAYQAEVGGLVTSILAELNG